MEYVAFVEQWFRWVRERNHSTSCLCGAQYAVRWTADSTTPSLTILCPRVSLVCVCCTDGSFFVCGLSFVYACLSSFPSGSCVFCKGTVLALHSLYLYLSSEFSISFSRLRVAQSLGKRSMAEVLTRNSTEEVGQTRSAVPFSLRLRALRNGLRTSGCELSVGARHSDFTGVFRLQVGSVGAMSW